MPERVAASEREERDEHHHLAALIGGERATRYLNARVSGTVWMYTESATRYRADTVNAVTGRSCSTTVWELAGITSVNQGDAASCRRNVVYAWMSTVLP